MDLGLSGKVALVTGGSKGIGRAISLELAENGCRVVIVAREQSAIDDTVRSISESGGTALGISADLKNLETYPWVVSEAAAAFGPPEVAVFNLEAPKAGSFERLTDADFLEAYHLVVTCFSNLVRAIVPEMKARKWGRIVTVGSGTAKQPIRSSANFSYVLANTHRVAAVGLCKTLAADLAPAGITVNTIATGSIGTGRFRAFFEERAAEAGIPYQAIVADFARRIPVGRLGTPSEVAGLCAYLCSERASFTTGETILCDGGQVESMF